jgi:hypothetical protein
MRPGIRANLISLVVSCAHSYGSGWTWSQWWWVDYWIIRNSEYRVVKASS